MNDQEKDKHQFYKPKILAKLKSDLRNSQHPIFTDKITQNLIVSTCGACGTLLISHAFLPAGVMGGALLLLTTALRPTVKVPVVLSETQKRILSEQIQGAKQTQGYVSIKDLTNVMGMMENHKNTEYRFQ